MNDTSDPNEDEQITDAPIEGTRDDGGGFDPVKPDGVQETAPAIPDPKDSQNPPPRRL